MRSIFCIQCGKKIYVSATGPFKCDKCRGGDDKNKPKFGGTSG
jgi:hypothetical protein